MSQEITRMYASPAAAAKAADALREEGYGDIFVVNPPPDGTPLSAIAAQIAEGRVYLGDAKVYAKGVAAGHALVTVHAPFASGRKATVILDSYNPIPSGKPEPEPEVLWNEATPFSSAMHMPLLLDDPAPASRYIGISPLAGSNCSFSGMIGLPLLSEGDAMPEGRWGLPFLSNNPAPLSSLLGLPLLKNSRNT